jgi:arylsulfatase A-like enzyme
VPDAEVEAMIAAYDGAIAYMDTQLRLLLQELARRGELDQTVVVVTSDHGEEFGEHGCFDHSHSLYLPSVHVPLLLRLPANQRTATRVDAPVSLRDLAATVLNLANVPNEPGIPGMSWARHWAGGSPPVAPHLLSEVRHFDTPEWMPISRGDMHALIQGDWRYIRNGDGTEELYRFPSDPWERRDLSETNLDALRQLRAQLNFLLASAQRRGPTTHAARQNERDLLAAHFRNR